MLVLHGSLKYVQSTPYVAILQIFLFFSMTWYCRVQSSAVSKRQDVRWCSVHWSISLSIDYVWESSMGSVISTPSCTYCIWNRYLQNHCRVLPKFLLFVWLYTVEFYRLPCPNDKMCDVLVFAHRFRCPLAMFGNPVLIWLSGLLRPSCSFCIWNR